MPTRSARTFGSAAHPKASRSRRMGKGGLILGRSHGGCRDLSLHFRNRELEQLEPRSVNEFEACPEHHFEHREQRCSEVKMMVVAQTIGGVFARQLDQVGSNAIR